MRPVEREREYEQQSEQQSAVEGKYWKKCEYRYVLTAVFQSSKLLMLRALEAFSGFLTAVDTACTSKHFGVRDGAYINSSLSVLTDSNSGSVLRVLPVLAVFRPLILLIMSTIGYFTKIQNTAVQVQDTYTRYNNK